VARKIEQGKRVSQLVAIMVTQLNAYTGSKRTRYRYVAFREAKRELYKLRPDIAPGVMKFVLSRTHWGTAGPSGFAELQAQRRRDAAKAKRQSRKR
jgi:hypothetical protein